MAKRTSGTARVTLYAAGCRYFSPYYGVGAKFRMSDKTLTTAGTTFDATGLNLVDTDPLAPITAQPATATYKIGDRTAVGSAIYLDAGQSVLKTDWSCTGGTWEQLDDQEYAGYVIHQRDATENTAVMATSKFLLPANPIIAMSLWRGEPNKDADRLTYPARTAICFGVNGEQFALVIPYGGEAAYVVAMNQGTGKWQRLEADHGTLGAFEGIGKGQRLQLLIGVWGGKICVAFGRGRCAESEFTTFPIPSMYWQLSTISWDGSYIWQPPLLFNAVLPGHVQVWHNAGQVMFRWWPVYMYSAATTYLVCHDTVDAGYQIWDSDTVTLPAGVAITSGDTAVWKDSVWRASATYGPIDTIEPLTDHDPTVTPWCPREQTTPTSSEATRFKWYSGWSPVRWHCALDTLGDVLPYECSTSHSGIHTCTTPLLYAAQVAADPVPADYAAWPATTDVTGEVQSLSIDHGEAGHIAQATLTLKNQTGTLSAAAANQLLTIELGYNWSDGTSDLTSTPLVFVGYIASPGRSADPGSKESLQLVAYGPEIRLRDFKCTGTEPDFQAYSEKDAIAWLAKRCGFAAAQLDLLGSTTIMALKGTGYDGSDYSGEQNEENDSLVPAFGGEPLDFCLDIAKRDRESLLYCWPDATEKFILHKSDGQPGATDGTLFTLEEDADDSAGTKYHLYHVDADQVGMDSSEYADRVIVRGKTPKGKVITVAYSDADTEARFTTPADEDYGGGWRHIAAETREHLTTEDQVRQRAAKRLDVLKRRPICATVITDVIATLKFGDRFKTTAAGTGPVSRAGVKDLTFRVQSIRYQWAGAESMPRMTLTGRTIA